MKRVLFVLLLLGGCAKESSVDPAKTATFIRYFNGGNNDEAASLIEATDGGLIILANTSIQNSETLAITTKIKLIKTDAFGNQLWQKFYPEFPAVVPTTPEVSYVANGITINPDGGYVIVGEAINQGKSKLLILTVDNDGNNPKANSQTATAPERVGKSVSTNAAGNFVVLAQIPNSATSNMMLGEYSKTSLDSLWVRKYGAGEIVNLSNKLHLNSQGAVFWGGTVKKGDSTIRFVKTPPNSQNTEFDLALGKPGFTETSNDIVKYGTGFASVGKSNRRAEGTKSNVFNILFKRLTESGTELTAPETQIYNLSSQDGDAEANSVCVAQDGGLVILATAKLLAPQGRGENDYVVMKINAFGTPVWTQSYGSKFDDKGKSIITSTDGGHVILGTTNLANVKTLLLMKVNQNGDID